MARGDHILIIEDDLDLLELERDIISAAGYEVSCARNGVAALNALRLCQPDLILLDMLMPVMDGWEFAARYDAIYARAAPIVVITAAEHTGERGAEIGADAVISKPFEVEGLLATVARVLDDGRRRPPAGHESPRRAPGAPG